MGYNQIEFAALGGAKKHSQINYEADKSSPASEYLSLLSRHDVDVLYILTGERRSDPPSPFARRFLTRHGEVGFPDVSRPGHGDISHDGMECVFVAEAALSSDSGSGIDDAPAGADKAVIALPVSWFNHRRLNSDLVVIVRAQGSDMAPTIPEGALVLLHVAERTAGSSGVYAIKLDGRACFRRLVPQSGEKSNQLQAIAVLAEGPNTAPVILSGKDLARLSIIGRAHTVIADV